ncbi:MAG TPA: tetratricopeptide repeat protein, partial [Candidatus Krumholzibacterium sp.]|nr:tetratricopeptide repeat protein [Candidatus Krumholzibacterium sp.]
KRQEYDEALRRRKIDSKDTTAIKEKDQKSASLAFRQAKEAMRDGFYDKAVILLKSAMRHSPDNPTYMSWYGFSLGMTGRNLHEARDACKKAVQMEFYNSDYHANLGFVYFKAGLKKQALTHFTEALKWNPSNAIAGKYMSKVDSGKPINAGPIDKLLYSVKNIFSH